MKKMWFIVTVVLSGANTHAHFFNEKAKGWHWYQAEPGPKRQRDVARDDPWTHKQKDAASDKNKSKAETSKGCNVTLPAVDELAAALST